MAVSRHVNAAVRLLLGKKSNAADLLTKKTLRVKSNLNKIKRLALNNYAANKFLTRGETVTLLKTSSVNLRYCDYFESNMIVIEF